MQGMYHQAVLGDLNTMAHGIARFSSKFCTDKMRFWSLGQSEAAFWQHNIFDIVDYNTIPEQDEAQYRPRPSKRASQVQHASSTAGIQEGSASQAESAANQQSATQEAGSPALFPPGLLGPGVNGPLRSWGLSEDVCRDITNPGMLPSCAMVMN